MLFCLLILRHRDVAHRSLSRDACASTAQPSVPAGATPKRDAFAHSLAIARDRTRCRYLARFLLNYDPSARAYWAASGASLALLPVPGSDAGGDAGGGGGAASGAASAGGAATDAASRVQRLREEQVRT